MVQILPLIGAAALLAQTAFGAAVPVKRTQYNNNYNQGSSNQDSNQSGNGNSYNQQYNNQYQQQQQNQDSNQNGNAYQVTTTAMAEMVHETTTAMMHETTTMMMHDTTTVEAQQMMHDTTTTAMAQETTVMMHDTTTMDTSSVQAQETSTAEYSMPTYGSGSSSWDNSGYNNCVSQCMAQFGAPPSTMSMGSQESLPSATGTGAVHTVLVAPTGAGLRYMPFALNATVGDTIRYVWSTPNNHTATLSSALAICNKSGIAESRNFVSGVKNAAQGTQVFDVTVETAEPQFFYCSVAQHCQKGMFGIINPTSAQVGANVGSMMTSMMQSNPGMQAAYSYAMQNVTSTAVKNWGMTMSLDGIPESAYPDVAANVLFTQANFGANPGMMESGLGATNPDGSPVSIVSGLDVLLSNTNAVAPTNVNAAVSASTPAAASTASLTPVNAYGNGASKSSAGVWVAAVVGIAGWLLI